MTTHTEHTHHKHNLFPQHNFVNADFAVGDRRRMFYICSCVNWCQKALEAS